MLASSCLVILMCVNSVRSGWKNFQREYILPSGRYCEAGASNLKFWVQREHGGNHCFLLGLSSGSWWQSEHLFAGDSLLLGYPYFEGIVLLWFWTYTGVLIFFFLDSRPCSQHTPLTISPEFLAPGISKGHQDAQVFRKHCISFSTAYLLFFIQAFVL